MHEVLVNRLGGLSLPRKSVVRLTDMTLDVSVDVKQQQQLLQKFKKNVSPKLLSYLESKDLRANSIDPDEVCSINYFQFLAIQCKGILIHLKGR